MFKIILLSFLVANLSFAQQKKMRAVNEPPLRKGAVIEIQKYDSATRLYYLILVNERGVGPNRAKFEDLLKAVTTLEKVLVTNRPESIVGNQYTLDAELPLLADLGVEKRQKSLGHRK